MTLTQERRKHHATLNLHQSLGRSPSQECIMETIGIERVPARCTLPWRGGGSGLGIGT